MNKNNTLFNLLKQHKWEEFINILKEDEYNEIDVNLRDEGNVYLIQYAINFNRKDIVSLLISRGAKLDIVDADKRCLLFIPIKYNYKEIISLLLHFNKVIVGISLIDMKDKDGMTPLHYAVNYNNIEAVETLLKYNADPNIKNKNGVNSLHLSIYIKNIDIFNILLETDVDINAVTNLGESALHYACNFQLYDVCEKLLKKGINPNIKDNEDELSAIVYAITLNNFKIFKLLLKYKADVNIQDYYGNTPLHYVIIENNMQFFDELEKYKIDPNIYNTESKTPLHIALESMNQNTNHYIRKIIGKTDVNIDVNIQNNIGNTILHLLVALEIWKEFTNELIKKQLNIFIPNIKNKKVIDLVLYNEKDKFLNMVAQSYLYQLKNSKTKKFMYKWETKCAETKEDNKCVQLIKKEIIKNNISFPIIKNNEVKISLDKQTCVNFTTFTGITLDIMIGLLYLLDKHSNTCASLTTNFKENDELENYYLSLGITNNSQTDYLNFEIVWVYQKLFVPRNFQEHIKLCKSYKHIKYILIPLGIELHNGSHANYLIYDLKNNEVERFEPNGAHNPYRLNYNPDLLDELLEKQFKQVIPNIKYIRPKDYLPKISFQIFDSIESNKYKRIGDPGGFCAVWTIWYVDMRLSNPNIPRKQLVNEIITKIKQHNMSFKNLIRNYSTNITAKRDEILEQNNLDINDWINDQYTQEQLENINNTIKQHIISFQSKRKIKLSRQNKKINNNKIIYVK